MKLLRSLFTSYLVLTIGLVSLNWIQAQERQASTSLGGVMLAQRGNGHGGHGRGRHGRGGKGHEKQGGGRFGRGMDQDHQLIFYLLEHRNEISRKVIKTANGIDTLTESQNPEVAAVIQKHVAAMYKRVENVQPIHMRDPLFRALFSNAKKIKMEMKLTAHGIRVLESSNDPLTARLIQAHADTVSLFLKNGFPEVRKNHAVPQ